MAQCSCGNGDEVHLLNYGDVLWVAVELSGLNLGSGRFRNVDEIFNQGSVRVE